MAPRPIIIAVVIIIIIAGVFFIFQSWTKTAPANQKVRQSTNSINNMKIESAAFAPGESIPSEYTCDGKNINPPLAISDVPTNAKSLVLIMDDPDAVKPAGKVWDHWIVWNIPPDTKTIPEDQEPPGIHGAGTSGDRSYNGPCPPDTKHRYFFRLYALNAMLDMPEGSTKKEIEKAMKEHIIESAELVGTYDRPR